MRVIIQFVSEEQQVQMDPSKITKFQWEGLHVNEHIPCNVTVVDEKNYMIELDGEWFYSQEAINDQKNKKWWQFWR